MTYKRPPHEFRESKKRNFSCDCGKTKSVEVTDKLTGGTSSTKVIQVPLKYKHCCMKKTWIEQPTNWPNNLGNYQNQIS